MAVESTPRFRLPRLGLRARIALGVALPVLLTLIFLSVVRYQRQRDLVDGQVRLTVLQVGQVMIGALRQQMLVNNTDMLAQTVSDIGSMETVKQVQIVDLDGRVKVSSRRWDVGTIRQQSDLGCVECHQYPQGSRPDTTRVFPASDVVRVSMPIPNGPSCVSCHPAENVHLGVLLADISVVNIEGHLAHNLQVDLATSLGGVVFVTLVLYLLINHLVVRRVEAFHRPLAAFAAGDLTARLPVAPGLEDELGDLANAFNRMAGELEHTIEEREKRTELRQRAIVEERERIARELHDGLAQLLGYVNTKAFAVRLMLKNHQMEAADRNLLQLEEAARGLFVDVREAILGLKTAGQDNGGLAGRLRDFTREFGTLSDLPVELDIDPRIEKVPLTAEAELQLLRIVQESLTNIRKHALAAHASIRLRADDDVLVLTVSDDGQGFDPDHVQNDDGPHFGWSTMNERAKAIGAEFSLDSVPGHGTRTTVRLPLEKG